jgi:hypothetical protein
MIREPCDRVKDEFGKHAEGRARALGFPIFSWFLRVQVLGEQTTELFSSPHRLGSFLTGYVVSVSP